MSKRRVAAATIVVLLAGLGGAAIGQPANADVTVTTSHTGSGAPALAYAGGRLYVAWTGSHGTASAKELQVGYTTDNGQHITKINTAERTRQGEGPALVADPHNPAGVVLAWADGRTGDTLTATVYDGTTFGCRTAFVGLTTRHAPALAADPFGGNLYLAWTDAANHLNVARLSTEDCPVTHAMELVGRTVLPQTSPYGPGMVFDTTGPELGALLAWVAPDAAHTLTVASWVGSTTLARVTTVDTAGARPTSASLNAWGSDLYVSFRASDNHWYLGYSEGCLPPCFNPTDIGTVVASGIGGAVGSLTYSWFNPAGNLVIYNVLESPVN